MTIKYAITCIDKKTNQGYGKWFIEEKTEEKHKEIINKPNPFLSNTKEEAEGLKDEILINNPDLNFYLEVIEYEFDDYFIDKNIITEEMGVCCYTPIKETWNCNNMQCARNPKNKPKNYDWQKNEITWKMLHCSSFKD